MIFSPLSLSRPPFSLVLCDLRWNSPDPSTRNGATYGFSWAPRDCEGFLLMMSGAPIQCQTVHFVGNQRQNSDRSLDGAQRNPGYGLLLRELRLDKRRDKARHRRGE